MSKYKKHFLTMLEENQELVNHFKSLQKDSVEFHAEGNKVMRVIRRYEDELCSKSEGGKYGVFSQNLSEKFWEEVRGYFPEIDSVRLE
jgi:hypothetical protein